MSQTQPDLLDMPSPTDKAANEELEFVYPQKSKGELQNAYYVLKLLSNPLIVSLSSSAALLALKLHLPIGFAIKRTIFKHFCGGETLKESEATIARLGESGIGTTLDYSVESKDSESFFEQTKQEIVNAISYVEDNNWVNNLAIKPTGLISESLLDKTSQGIELNAREKIRFVDGVDRINQICEAGKEKGVEIYIDAERSGAQDAIDGISIAMMKKYNTDKVTVFITLQMYRTDRLNYLETLVNISKQGGFKVGVKLVRGAYWDRESALKKNVVYTKKSDTDAAYNKALDMCVANIDRFAICNATHNEESTRYLAKKMKLRGIANSDERIYFSQLYGMSDQISYTLADHGYNVTKYLPYGKVREVIPYLIRRAEENSSISGQMGREMAMIAEARKR
ncbi:MAG: proline dehydrogenase family protein [Flavobacteriales bacterium]|nr:proline dehydrogenase family protein [Flavobacteriales bacterium]